MSLWTLPSKLRQQHSQRSAEIVSAACWHLWIVGCFVLPSYLYGWETVMSFCSLALLFCASTSFWLWTECEVLHSVEIVTYFVGFFCKKQNTAWFNTSGWLNPEGWTIYWTWRSLLGWVSTMLQMYRNHTITFWNEFECLQYSQHVNHNNIITRNRPNLLHLLTFGQRKQSH